MKILVSILTALILLSVPAIAATIVDMDIDINNGKLDLTVYGIDTSTWHNGQTGETNELQATGDFKGTYKVNSGNYGALQSYVNLASDTSAEFIMEDWQDFNVMSANHNYNTNGYFYSRSAGNNAEMNIKSIGSMYVWSEATNPYWENSLKGNEIEKNAQTTQNGELITDLYMGVFTDGTAEMYNSNIWGWTNGEHATSSTNYGGGTRTVQATGNGVFVEYGYGKNSLTFNGFTFGGGSSATFSSPFAGGMSGTYSMSAN